MKCGVLALSGIAVGVMLLSASLQAQTRTENIIYTTDPAGAQRGDLYEPQGSGPFPAVIFLHGGSWRSGSKSEFKRLGMDLARQGYAGFSIDYDLKPNSFPLAWEEARAAVRFLCEHAAAYHVDPRRIVIAGTSAGGELAALVALAPEGPVLAAGETRPDASTPTVSAAVILNGVFDLCFPAKVIRRYLGGNCSSREDEFADASPVRHVHPDAPPFFVGHGTKDHVVPYKAAQLFIEDLQRDHVPVTPFVAQDGPHMYWEKNRYYQQNLAAVESFLASVIPRKGVASGSD